jgi:pimeloyl-ACP methyl ester carboxylesterase
VTLAYDRIGTGPPLLLVHGLGSCKEMWRPLLPRLAREREVVAVDMPGFGASPAGPRTVEGLAEALAEFSASLGLQQPHVAGNSLGGGVALVMGANGAASSVCAVSPIGFAAPREGTYGRAVLASTRRVAERLASAAPTVARSAVLRTVMAAHVAARPWRIPPEDTAQCQAPRARRLLPRADHVVLRGCGHVPTWDDPEQVAGVLLSASRRAEDRRRPAG